MCSRIMVKVSVPASRQRREEINMARRQVTVKGLLCSTEGVEMLIRINMVGDVEAMVTKTV